MRDIFGERVQIDWHAFELRPYPVPTLDPQGEYLRGTGERAGYPMAAQRGMRLRLSPVQPRSRRALEAAEFARDAGRHEAMHTALFRAFFKGGRDLDVLLEVAASVDLEPTCLQAALEAGQYTAKVQADRALPEQLGIRSVPRMLIGPATGDQATEDWVVGSQPFELLLPVLQQHL
ncbi:MAG: DsbA family oxidoreductase [Pseudomonadota bacterium]